MSEKPVTSFSFLTEICRFWFSTEFFAVGLSAFLGVAVRVALENKFSSSGVSNSNTGYGPFMQMFYAQSYLIPNFLGCFIMAVCITNMKPITGFSLPLYKALTTGMCGCITTFSSWINGAINILFDHGWYEMLIMILLEFWMTWSAFNMGYATAKMNFQLQELPFYKLMMSLLGLSKKPNAAETVNTSTPPPAATQAASTVAASKDIEANGKTQTINNPIQFSNTAPVNINIRKSVQFGGNVGTRDTMADVSKDGNFRLTNHNGMRDSTAFLQFDDEDEEIVDFNPFSARISVWREDGGQTDDVKKLNTLSVAKSALTKAKLHASTERQSTMRDVSIVSSDSQMVMPSNSIDDTPTLEPTKQRTQAELFTLWFQKYEYYIWCYSFITVAGFVWIETLLEYNITYYDEVKFRTMLRSVALAPLGAWLRWGLTRIPSIKARWPEMNPQTMIANLVAVVFMCFLNVLSTDSWVAGINNGFNGSCSTVSTFFAEIHSLYFEKGPFVALRYCMVTFILAIALVQIIRGGNQN